MPIFIAPMSPSPERPRSRWRLLRRVLFGVLVLVVLALIALSIWYRSHGQQWLDRTVRERIDEVVHRASVEGYTFTLGDLETDARNGDLVVTGARLSFDSTLMDSLKLGRLDYLFAAQADRIALRGLSFWRLLLYREFKAEAIELVAPDLRYIMGGARLNMAAPFQRIDGGGGVRIGLLEVDTVLIRRAACAVEDLGDRLPRLDIAGLEVAATQLRLAVGKHQQHVWVSTEEATFNLDSLGTTLPDGAHLHCGRITLDRRSRTGNIRDLRLDPSAHDLDSNATDRVQRTVLALHVNNIAFNGMDVDRLITHQVLSMRKLLVDGAQLDASLDKTLPDTPPQARALPPAALLALRFAVEVDTLAIREANVRYRERDATTGRWGQLPFTHMHARFAHVSNTVDTRAAPVPLTGTFSGMLFDSAAFSGTYDAELGGSQGFTFTAQVRELPCLQLDQATRPLLRMVVEDGQLHQLDLRIVGDERRAKGTVAMRMSDLRVRVEPGTPAEERHSMFGALLETMLAEEYGGGLDMDRRKSYQVERNTERGVFTYIWHVLREGIARNLLPEAMGRVKGMIRMDKAKLRAARTERRARKRTPK